MRMNKQAIRLYTLAALLFFVITLPILTFRGCRAAKQQEIVQPEIDILEKTTAEKIPNPAASIDIRVYNTKTERVEIMEMEEYLVGVLAAEMPASFESEALKAQAVAARTYAARKMPRFGGSGCGRGGDVCTDSAHCQAYRTVEQRRQSWGNNAAMYEAKIRTAIQETFGELATYQNQPIQAFFHSTSGGMTESSENAFSEALPYLRSVSSDEASAPRYENTVELSKKEFVNTVNKAYPKAQLKVKSVESAIKVISRFESGRIDRLQLGKTEINGRQMRALFDLDSNNIRFEFSQNSVIMHTKGYGHGVGLSQNGANDLAKTGADYREILAYYYVDTDITKYY